MGREASLTNFCVGTGETSLTIFLHVSVSIFGDVTSALG